MFENRQILLDRHERFQNFEIQSFRRRILPAIDGLLSQFKNTLYNTRIHV
jgi:hypothetical protein